MSFAAAIKPSIQRTLNTELGDVLVKIRKKKQYTISLRTLSFGDFLSDKMLIIQVIQEGIPYSFFEAIQLSTPFSDHDWSDLLHLSTRSMTRYKKNAQVFESLQSEKIIEAAEVTKMGLEVFGDMDKFRNWLHTPSFALGNLKPFDLLSGSYGKELVLGELTRIQHGIFA